MRLINVLTVFLSRFSFSVFCVTQNNQNVKLIYGCMVGENCNLFVVESEL